MALPVKIISEDGGDTVVLKDRALPTERIEHGGSLSTEETNYASGATSVQITGRERDAVPLKGTLADSQGGEVGFAKKMRDQIRNFSETGKLVKYRHGEEQFWGVISKYKFTEQSKHEFDYDIEIKPYFFETPKKQELADYTPPPADSSANLRKFFDVLVRKAKNPPDEVKDSLAKKMLLNAASAAAKYAKAHEKLRKAEGFAEIAKDSASLITNITRGAINKVDKMVDLGEKIRRTTALQGPGGAAEFIAGDWAMGITKTARETAGDLRRFIRKLSSGQSPSTGTTYVVGEGDTLREIAESQLGDYSRWTEIADLNDLDRPGNIEAGDEIKLPPTY